MNTYRYNISNVSGKVLCNMAAIRITKKGKVVTVCINSFIQTLLLSADVCYIILCNTITSILTFFFLMYFTRLYIYKCTCIHLYIFSNVNYMPIMSVSSIAGDIWKTKLYIITLQHAMLSCIQCTCTVYTAH